MITKGSEKFLLIFYIYNCYKISGNEVCPGKCYFRSNIAQFLTDKRVERAVFGDDIHYNPGDGG
jgi:hypothetical protein